ncbi:MAG: sensor domain-containing diguanylate cyclase [Candidatus Nanopelagicales bacterium]
MDQIARMAAIIDTQRRIIEADPSLAGVMRIVVQTAQELTGATGSVVELAEGDDMVYAATLGSVEGNEGLHLSLHSSLSGLCVRTGQSQLCVDSDSDPRVDAAACRRVGARSMVVVPLVHRTRTIGVLKVVSDQPGAFAEEDVDLLSTLAGFIASAIQHAGVFDDTFRRASEDELTGLRNRASFSEALSHGLARAKREGTQLGVVYLDLDRFKPINDTYGHEAGDAVLAEVGRRMRATCRAEDTVARVGGDEFAVVTEHHDREQMGALAERLTRVIAQPVTFGDHELSVGCSAGVAMATPTDIPESLAARADAAMYSHKSEGRARTA